MGINLNQALSAAGDPASSREDAKMVKAGKDFESILLGSWLQQAEQSFATVPGGDGDGDGDPGKDQFQGIAMQGLAGSLTASGGIGIARMITSSLRAHHGSEQGDDPHAAVSGHSRTSAQAVAPRGLQASSVFSDPTLNKSP